THGLYSNEETNPFEDHIDWKDIVKCFINEKTKNFPELNLLPCDKLNISIENKKCYSYSPAALQNIFHRPSEGFNVLKTFKINNKGHVSVDSGESLLQSGVIVQYNPI